MEYFVSAADEEVARRYADRLRSEGMAVVEEYTGDEVVVSLGGDGAILYNARQYGDPTILPVVTGGSEGNKIQVEDETTVDRVVALEEGTRGEDYHVESHRKLAASSDGEPIEGFEALNDVHLHHVNPVRAAKFRTRFLDDGVVFETDNVIGDGLLVATPFGSTAYYRSITDGTFAQGLGVAFNNPHRPADAPKYRVLSEDAVVEVQLQTTGHPNAALYRDDDPDPYHPDPGETVAIALSDRTVDVIRLDD